MMRLRLCAEGRIKETEIRLFPHPLNSWRAYAPRSEILGEYCSLGLYCQWSCPLRECLLSARMREEKLSCLLFLCGILRGGIFLSGLGFLEMRKSYMYVLRGSRSGRF